MQETTARKGLLFTFEGIDASGKETQSKMLHSHLKEKGFETEYISFPDYETSIGKEIRAFLYGSKEYNLETRHVLYAANRYEHKQNIETWLREGKIVLANRYSESNIAYGAASGLPLQWLQSVESQMPRSDYVFLLRVSTEVSERRKQSRDRFEIDPGFLRRVSLVYDAFAEQEKWFVIEGDRPKDIVHYEISKLAVSLIQEDVENKTLER